MRRVTMRSAIMLSAAMAAAATLGAGPQQAAWASSPFCDPALAEQVPGPGVDALGRGGSGREPDVGQVHQDLPAGAKGKAPSDFTATVPVYFHVVTDGSLGALTDAEVASQIRILNMTFAGREGGATTGFSFALAGVTRTDDADWFYANPGGTNEHTMKQVLHQGGTDALNLYSTTAGDYLGWAYLPDILTKPGQAYLDGVVFDWESIPGTSDRYAGRYDEGETATHEVGHWLNLEHTFFGGCSAKGDFVDDTPAQKTPTSGCPEGKDTCTAAGLDPIHNYMDYSYDSCYTEFTVGQTQRVRDAWLLYRA